MTTIETSRRTVLLCPACVPQESFPQDSLTEPSSSLSRRVPWLSVPVSQPDKRLPPPMPIAATTRNTALLRTGRPSGRGPAPCRPDTGLTFSFGGAQPDAPRPRSRPPSAPRLPLTMPEQRSALSPRSGKPTPPRTLSRRSRAPRPRATGVPRRDAAAARGSPPSSVRVRLDLRAALAAADPHSPPAPRAAPLLAGRRFRLLLGTSRGGGRLGPKPLQRPLPARWIRPPKACSAAAFRFGRLRRDESTP